MHVIDKNAPSPEWFASLRKRYPTEREIDRIVTQKRQRRVGPGYSPLPLAKGCCGRALPDSGRL